MKKRNWKYLNFGTLVQVTWIDSAGVTNSWECLTEFELKPYTMLSVGYVWVTSNSGLAIAPHISKDKKLATGVMLIPWCSILKIKKI